MPLVTEVEVRGIYTTDEDKSLIPFIEAADLIVTEDLAGQGLSDARLKQVELYLAAHFAQVSDGGDLSSEKAGDATDTYNKKAELGFASTQFGQTAMALDTSGTLVNFGATPMKKARIVLIGPATARRRGRPDPYPMPDWEQKP